MRLIAVTSAALLTAGAICLNAPSATADVRDGACTSDTGVTLVVDFQELGGGRIVRCVEDVEPGTSGLQILQAAGMSPEGTRKDGPSFVCRINGRPGVNETIALRADPTYREKCVATPPDTAFWSYWHADNGGSWTFSNQGATTHEAIIGGYEGWSFSLEKSNGSSPAPGVRPSHPVVGPSPTPSPEPAPQQSASKEPPTKSPATKAPATKKATAKATAAAPSTARSTPTGAASANATTAATQSAPVAPSTSAVATPTPSMSIRTATASPAATASAAPPVAAEQEPLGGLPLGTIAGVGAVSALGLGGGLVWWRRRGL